MDWRCSGFSRCTSTQSLPGQCTHCKLDDIQLYTYIHVVSVSQLSSVTCLGCVKTTAPLGQPGPSYFGPWISRRRGAHQLLHTVYNTSSSGVESYPNICMTEDAYNCLPSKASGPFRKLLRAAVTTATTWFITQVLCGISSFVWSSGQHSWYNWQCIIFILMSCSPLGSDSESIHQPPANWANKLLAV